MKWNWRHNGKKVCFLCAGPVDKDNFGYLEYSFRENDGSRGVDKEKICALCCERVNHSTTITKGENDEQD